MQIFNFLVLLGKQADFPPMYIFDIKIRPYLCAFISGSAICLINLNVYFLFFANTKLFLLHGSAL